MAWGLTSESGNDAKALHLSGCIGTNANLNTDDDCDCNGGYENGEFNCDCTWYCDHDCYEQDYHYDGDSGYYGCGDLLYNMVMVAAAAAVTAAVA